MKKVFFSILLIGFGLLGYSQDKIYEQANFSTFPPTGWSVLNGAGSSGHWAKTCYPIIRGDVVAQNEWMISPGINCSNAVNDRFRVSFKYMTSTSNSSHENVYLLMSTDGTTWAPYTTTYTPNVWDKNTYFPGTADDWFPSGTLDISTDAKGHNIKLAFVYRTDGGAGVPDGYFAVDDVLVEKSTDAGVTWADWSASDFETGITSASWTTVNTPAPGSSKHFVDHYLAKVKDDPTNAQDERLMTKEYTFSDNSLTSLKFSVNWFAFSNTSGIYGAYLYASTDHGTTFNFIDDISTTSTDQNSVQQISFSLLNSYKGKSVMFAIYFTDGAGNIEDFFVDSLKVHQVFDGTVGNDAKITLGDLDTLIYPVLDKYNAVAPTGIKEGLAGCS